MKLFAIIVVMCSLLNSVYSGTCTISGDPHFYYFTDDSDSTGHHYQGGTGVDELNESIRYYYIVACQQKDDPSIILTGTNRFQNDIGFPFAISAAHDPCNGGSVSCIYDIEIDIYNDATIPEKQYIFRLSNDKTDVTTANNEYDIVGGATQNSLTDNVFTVYKSSDASAPFLTITVTTTTTSITVVVTDVTSASNLVSVTFNYKKFPSVTIDMDDNEIYRICGLCGNYENKFDSVGDIDDIDANGAHILITDTDRRRRGLLSNILYLDSTGMNSWSQMKNDDSIWERTMLFGDAWAVDEEVTTNVSSLFFPSDDCIDVGTDFCTQFYYSTDSYCSSTCEDLDNEKTEKFIGFDNWLQGCIFDTCAAGANDDMAVEALTYDEVLAFGFFEAALDTCDGLCSKVGQCPIACQDSDGNEIECDCSDDSNCQNCQSHGQCSQCQSGYFKKSYNHECYKCEEYAGFGCMFCQDFNGCGQCQSGYTRVKDDECGLYTCEKN